MYIVFKYSSDLRHEKGNQKNEQLQLYLEKIKKSLDNAQDYFPFTKCFHEWIHHRKRCRSISLMHTQING